MWFLSYFFHCLSTETISLFPHWRPPIEIFLFLTYPFSFLLMNLFRFLAVPGSPLDFRSIYYYRICIAITIVNLTRCIARAFKNNNERKIESTAYRSQC